MILNPKLLSLTIRSWKPRTTSWGRTGVSVTIHHESSRPMNGKTQYLLPSALNACTHSPTRAYLIRYWSQKGELSLMPRIRAVTGIAAHLCSWSQALMEKDWTLANPALSTSRRVVVTTVPRSVTRHVLLKWPRLLLPKLLCYMNNYQKINYELCFSH